jgi:hypothetical protein
MSSCPPCRPPTPETRLPRPAGRPARTFPTPTSRSCWPKRPPCSPLSRRSGGGCGAGELPALAERGSARQAVQRHDRADHRRGGARAAAAGDGGGAFRAERGRPQPGPPLLAGRGPARAAPAMARAAAARAAGAPPCVASPGDGRDDPGARPDRRPVRRPRAAGAPSGAVAGGRRRALRLGPPGRESPPVSVSSPSRSIPTAPWRASWNPS